MKLKKKIKICGIKSFNDIKNILKIKINILGFVIYSKSKRYLNYNSLCNIFSKRYKYKKILVLVNQSINLINKLIIKHFIFKFQLHGNENYLECLKLSKKLNISFIKIFYISNNFYENKEIFNYLKISKINYLNLENLECQYGGTGKKNNYFFIFKNKKIIISGGISEKNVPILKNLYYYDISSSIEKNGNKDKKKIYFLKKKIKNAIQLS
ncbi:phosphoribosylanthranilate isomerase [Candidatus Vidania fulgoroideorum]